LLDSLLQEIEMKQLECDYLVIGCGASAMAFLDEMILMNKTNLKVIVVDRRAKPGGHWVDAYDFVRLHQPSATYGVNSRPLGSGDADLCSKYQILAYYELVMADMLATGRLEYFPLCEYKGKGRFSSLIDAGLEYEVKVRKKTVDATRMETSIPSTAAPKYQLEDGVECIPINGLARLKSSYNKYVVVGAGKTGLDALLFLLDNNIPQDKILWVVSNDCWYYTRLAFSDPNLKDIFKNIFTVILGAETLEDLYLRYEKHGIFQRVDKNIWPTKMRAATISKEEADRFRTLKDNIIREGRVQKISKKEMVFQNGTVLPVEEGTLFINCTAGGTIFKEPSAIFPDNENINLQMLQIPAPTYSGAIIAAAEVKFGDNLEKLRGLGEPLDAPHDLPDWFALNATSLKNVDKIGKTLGLGWMWRSRLSGMKLLGFKMFFFFATTIKRKIPSVIETSEKVVADYKEKNKLEK